MGCGRMGHFRSDAVFCANPECKAPEANSQEIIDDYQRDPDSWRTVNPSLSQSESRSSVNTDFIHNTTTTPTFTFTSSSMGGEENVSSCMGARPPIPARRTAC